MLRMFRGVSKGGSIATENYWSRGAMLLGGHSPSVICFVRRRTPCRPRSLDGRSEYLPTSSRPAARGQRAVPSSAARASRTRIDAPREKPRIAWRRASRRRSRCRDQDPHAGLGEAGLDSMSGHRRPGLQPRNTNDRSGRSATSNGLRKSDYDARLRIARLRWRSDPPTAHRFFGARPRPVSGAEPRGWSGTG